MFGDDTDDKYGYNDLSQVKLLEGEITFSNSKQYTAKYVSTIEVYLEAFWASGLSPSNKRTRRF